MLKLLDKKMCSGCYACEEICPKSCIEMKSDSEGFWYPTVNTSECVDCHLCEKACPIITPLRQPDEKIINAYAAINKNEEIRLQSSSGGIFTALAEYIINNGGVVFGAAFSEDFSVRHICVDNAEDLQKLRGSKYLQSKIGNAYSEAKKHLDNKRLVLFSGTPCQIEGLLSFLRRDYDNLYTQDIICHGVPSPMVWQKYIKFREKNSVSKTRRTFFRHKKYGWKMYSVQFEFSNCTEYIQAHKVDLYMTSFLRNWCLRPSCYACHFKKLNRLSDITLADFWGVENVAPEMDDDKGTSLVFVHSEKGTKLFQSVSSEIISKPVSTQEAIKYNPSMTTSVPTPPVRAKFMKDIRQRNFEKCVEKYLHPKKSFKHILKGLVRKMFGNNITEKVKAFLRR